MKGTLPGVPSRSTCRTNGHHQRRLEPLLPTLSLRSTKFPSICSRRSSSSPSDIYDRARRGQKRTVEEDFPIMPPRNLLSVCRLWRDVVLSTHVLWTQWSIFIYNDNLIPMTTHVVQQHLARSGDAPLTFEFRLLENDDSHVGGELFRIIASTQRRWKRVLISGHIQLDATQLALAPLSHLSLNRTSGKLGGSTDGLSLDKLNILEVVGSHPSY